MTEYGYRPPSFQVDSWVPLDVVNYATRECSKPPSRKSLLISRLVASNAGTSSSPVAFRPNRSSTQVCRAHSGRYSPETPIPLNPNAQNRPPPFAENCASPAHNRRCSGKRPPSETPPCPQSNQRSIAASRILLPAPRRRPLVACAAATTFSKRKIRRRRLANSTAEAQKQARKSFGV